MTTHATGPKPLRVLILGASSAIARQVCRRYAARGARLFLAARRQEALADDEADLRVRGATDVLTMTFDAVHIATHAAMIDAAFAAWGGIDVALVAYGVLPDQAESEASVDALLSAFDVNARATLVDLSLIASRLQRQGSGVMGVVSSVAGERGRASNYAYGAAKSAVSTFAAGLRHRLHRSGVRVVTVLPGFVDTPMTAAFAKGPLWASADRVAADIERALDHRSGVVYSPWFWRPVMLLIRAIPERLFVKTRL